MRRSVRGRFAAGRGGFTLIELLVVVAIIALLISILLPSLGQARAQSRNTLCATRIAQITKGMILYSNDYDETPPFIGIGFENCGQTGKTYEGKDRWTFWADQETWCLPGGTQGWVQNNCYMIPQKDWPDYCKVENGSLFAYTKFANLYRCPEFERVPGKDQEMYNYTRAVTGRKVLSSFMNDPGVTSTFEPGPILKLSSVYAASQMFMMFDEQWDFHCATIVENRGVADFLSGYWMRMDMMNGVIGDMIGSYHGQLSKKIQHQLVKMNKSGNVSFYDGHVEMIQDPFPWRNFVEGSGGLSDWATLAADQNALHVIDILLQALYAQRGAGFTHAQIVSLLLGGG